MKVIKLLFIVTVLLLLASCAGGGGEGAPQNVVATYVAQTAAAQQQPPSPTHTLPPTDTSTPTNTPPPSDTPMPTNTNTPTGPVTFSDDFSTNSGAWSNCDVCEWTNGTLLMGPYAPKSNTEADYAICDPCGIVQYYVMSVEVTFVDGQSDRGYGLLLNLTDRVQMDVELTSWQVWGSWIYDRKGGTGWSPITGWDLTGIMNPSYGTNEIEVRVEPTNRANTATLSFKINGTVIRVVYNWQIEPGNVGLVMGFHSIQAAFDNFYFQEIEP